MDYALPFWMHCHSRVENVAVPAILYALLPAAALLNPKPCYILFLHYHQNLDEMKQNQTDLVRTMQWTPGGAKSLQG